MSDLSAYINFTALMDKSGITPVIVLRDTDAYPAGINTGLTGAFSVTQPDGVTIAGNFTTPDVTYTSGALTPKTIELRLASNGTFQKGLYSMTYTVKAPSYTDTTITKTFSIFYDQSKSIITSVFDVFKPLLKIFDQTNYTIVGYNAPTIARAWNAVIANVGTLTGSDAIFDLLFNTAYFDSNYLITLTTILNYVLTSSTWVTLRDKIITTGNYTTQVPPSLNYLYTELTSYESQIDDNCCNSPKTVKDNYVYAFTLFQHLIYRINCGATLSLLDLINKIQSVLNNGADYIYGQTYSPIIPYAANFCGYSNTSGGSGVGSSDSVVEFEIGSGSGYIVSNDKTQLTLIDTNNAHILINKTLLLLDIEGTRIPLVPRSTSVYATFDPTTGIITQNNGGVFSIGSYVAINYK